MIIFNIGQTIYIYNLQKNACSIILFNNVLSNLMNYGTKTHQNECFDESW